VPSELLYLVLFFLVGLLNLFQGRRQRRRLHANRGRLSPGATPGADSAAKRLIHARHCCSSAASRQANPSGSTPGYSLAHKLDPQARPTHEELVARDKLLLALDSDEHTGA